MPFLGECSPPPLQEPVGSGAVRDYKGSCALETDGAKSACSLDALFCINLHLFGPQSGP